MTAQHLPRSKNRTIQATFQLAERVWASRADLRATYTSIENPEFWIWLMWHGEHEVPEFAKTFFPVPPDHLLERIGGAVNTAQNFREGGIVEWRSVLRSFADAGFRFEHGRVLDFGCGCGRLLRNFARYAHACEFTGVDIDEGSIDWSKKHLKFAEFACIRTQPPTKLKSASFDAAFAISVFSHLPLHSQALWLDELARVLRRGAPAVLTIHGARAIERWLAGETPSSMPTADELRAQLPRLESEGFLFFPFTQMVTPHEGNKRFWREQDRSLYGNVFLTRAHVERTWLREFELVAFTPAPNDWQDYVVLRRK